MFKLPVAVRGLIWARARWTRAADVLAGHLVERAGRQSVDKRRNGTTYTTVVLTVGTDKAFVMCRSTRGFEYFYVSRGLLEYPTACVTMTDEGPMEWGDLEGILGHVRQARQARFG